MALEMAQTSNINIVYYLKLIERFYYEATNFIMRIRGRFKNISRDLIEADDLA